MDWDKRYPLEDGKSYTAEIRVHPRIAPYTITIRQPKWRPGMNPDTEPNLFITQKADPAFRQSFTVSMTEIKVSLDQFDYSLDGYTDFRVFDQKGSGGYWCDYLIYDPKRKRFVRGTEFEEAAITGVDPVKREGYARARNPPGWIEWTYRIIGGKPVFYKEVDFGMVGNGSDRDFLPASLNEDDLIVITTFFKNGKISRRFYRTVRSKADYPR